MDIGIQFSEVYITSIIHPNRMLAPFIMTFGWRSLLEKAELYFRSIPAFQSFMVNFSGSFRISRKCLPCRSRYRNKLKPLVKIFSTYSQSFINYDALDGDFHSFHHLYSSFPGHSSYSSASSVDTSYAFSS